MIYRTIWVSIYSFKCFKTVWSGLFTSTLFSSCSYRSDRSGMLLKFLRILITLMYFNDQKGIPKTVNCISCSMVYKIVFCSEFPDIPDNTGRFWMTQSHEKEKKEKKNTGNCRKIRNLTPMFAFQIFVRAWPQVVKVIISDN